MNEENLESKVSMLEANFYRQLHLIKISRKNPYCRSFYEGSALNSLVELKNYLPEEKYINVLEQYNRAVGNIK